MSATARKRAAFLSAAVIAATFLVLPAPLAAADSCKQYQGLIDMGYPQRALALLDAEVERLPDDASRPCEKQRDKAEDAIAEAEARIADLDETAQPEAQQEVVEAALALDRENARASAKQAEPGAATPPECSTYADLIEAGYPQRALGLIDAQTKRLPSGSATPCAAERSLAEQQVAEAEAEMARLDEDEGPAKQREVVDDTLAADRENARAVAKEKLLDADEAWATRVSKDWKTFWDEQLSPARNWVLALLGWLLAVAILLKLLTRVLGNRALPSVVPFRSAGTTTGWVGIALGGFLALRGQWWSVIVGTGVSLVAVALLLAYRRSRARLDITTSGDKAPSAEHVRAVLNGMNSETSGSIEMPTASDKDFMKDVVVLPESTGVVGKTVAALMGMMTLYSPWRLNVDAKTDDTVNVELYRNYERLDAAVLNRANLLLFLDNAERMELAAKEAKEPEKVSHDFAILAAAMALTAMAREHGFEHVLGGASKWRSVGLEYLARQLSLRDALRGRLLAEAVDVDAGNHSARLALWHHRYRHDNTLPAMKTYWDLTQDVAGQSISPILNLGACYGHVVAGVNLRAGVRAILDNTPKAKKWEKVREVRALQVPTNGAVKKAAETLLAEIENAKELPEGNGARDLAEAMEWSATTLAWSAGVLGEAPEEVELANRFTWGFTPHYNAACYWADKDTPDVTSAVRSLLLSGETSDSVWLGKDPQLRKLRKEQLFRETFGDNPRTDFLLLAPFSPYAEGLRKQALTTPRALAAATPSALRAAGVPFGLMRSLNHAGSFAMKMDDLEPLQVEILDALDKNGYRFTYPRAEERGDVEKKILDACIRFNKVLDPAKLTAFLNRPRRYGVTPRP